jgi:hypothetical protein
MTDNSKTQELLEEMRSKGNLPAINENVQAITQITHHPIHAPLILPVSS